MDAQALLRSWPTWARAGAERILASPAWRLDVRLGEERGTLTALPPADAGTARFGADAIRLAVTFDGAPAVLALADSPLYPDLHLLWERRAGLPEAVVLALVERECGVLFSLLEAVTRRQFAVKGPAGDDAPPPARAYTATGAAGSLAFALDFDAATLQRFAQLENLDVTHASIRSLTRPAHPDYTAFLLTAEERAALAADDLLLLPEGFPSAQAWAVEPAPEGTLHLVSTQEEELSFAAFADDALPPVPAPAALVLVSGATPLFACALTRVGEAPAVRLLPLTRNT